MRPIVILDFGSQFAHLIGNRIRRLGAYSEIVPVDTAAETIKALNPHGIILSGGPQSVFEKNSPQPDAAVFDLDIPILGICYGHHLITHHFGGNIESLQKEYGEAEFAHLGGDLFTDVAEISTVWMNHGDSVTALPEGFEITGKTDICPIAAYENQEKKLYSVQFHPEVTHSVYGMQMLDNFVTLCGAKGTWNVERAADQIISDLQQKLQDKNVFLLVSGGVDSSVAFALLTKAIGVERVFGLFVDSGLLRKNEAAQVETMLAAAGFQNLHVARESEYFLEKLAGITDPEAKRTAIGNAFLEVKRKWASKLGLDDAKWILGQGTIYPDHIETGGSAHASKIKTHHNRVPEIEQMIAEGRIVEPLADFYKDEVRDIGRKLGLSEQIVGRHPFPGPGLGVRILCQTEPNLLQNTEEIEVRIKSEFALHAKVLPVRSVGVQGDARSYRHPVAIFGDKPLNEILTSAGKIPNAYTDINRVVVALSDNQHPQEIFAKTPATITNDRVALLQEADARIRDILEVNDLYHAVWQFPVILAPVGLVPNTESIILRPILSENAMTATAVIFSPEILQQMATALMELEGISCVFLDLTSKPPGTIEWE